MINRKHFLALAAAALTCASGLAQAQGKPVEWVVGYAAGGGSDIVARAIAESMGKSLGRPVIINNKPGAGTNIAADYVARSKDLGNIIFSADFATLAANPFLFSKLTYDAQKDFHPVGLLVRFPMFLVVNPGVPASNLKEFSAWAQAQKDPVAWGSAGPGSPHHLAMELVKADAGITVEPVTFDAPEALSRKAAVTGPTSPSTEILLSFWKARTAASVFFPYFPSGLKL